MVKIEASEICIGADSSDPDPCVVAHIVLEDVRVASRDSQPSQSHVAL